MKLKSSFFWQPNAKKGGRAIKEPTFHQKCGVFGWQQRQSVTYGVIVWQQRWKYGVFGALNPYHLHNGSAPSGFRNGIISDMSDNVILLPHKDLLYYKLQYYIGE